jgi:hypothetical protein
MNATLASDVDYIMRVRGHLDLEDIHIILAFVYIYKRDLILIQHDGCRLNLNQLVTESPECINEIVKFVRSLCCE